MKKPSQVHCASRASNFIRSTPAAARSKPFDDSLQMRSFWMSGYPTWKALKCSGCSGKSSLTSRSSFRPDKRKKNAWRMLTSVVESDTSPQKSSTTMNAARHNVRGAPRNGVRAFVSTSVKPKVVLQDSDQFPNETIMDLHGTPDAFRAGLTSTRDLLCSCTP